MLIMALLFLGCNESDNTTSKMQIREEGSGSINHVEAGYSFIYTHALGAVPQDVYFIFTNTGLTDNPNDTTVTTYATQHNSETAGENSIFSGNRQSDISLREYIEENGILLKDRPELTGINTHPVSKTSVEKQQLFQIIPSIRQNYEEDSTGDFMDWDFDKKEAVTINAVLRKIVDVSADIILNLWVADNAYDALDATCDFTNCITETMLEQFGEKFLKAGEDNDIYDWLTSIFGVPWGGHSNSSYINALAAQQIDILFYDIDDDQKTNSGVLGFFWSKDNAIRNPSDTQNYTNISNQRLMFYIDSLIASNPDGGSWEISDEMPAIIVGTLAHEFQHMIHFYQKSIKNDLNYASETWINEMASMVAEDLVASKLEIDGPRGVKYDDGTAGSIDNISGRLPIFNKYNSVSVMDWFAGNSAIINYGLNYALGAYLARNYGGAELFRNIVQNDKLNYLAIEQALTSMGYNLNIGFILQKWGAAVVLSDILTVQAGYQYNTGSFFTSALDGNTYELGSINMFNYDPKPTISEPQDPVFTISYHNRASNTYIKVGSGLTGTVTWEVHMPENVKLTVVTKDS